MAESSEIARSCQITPFPGSTVRRAALTARGWILAHGGVEATRVFTRIWLALSGLWSWDDLPVIPPELIYLPSWFPLNIYDWGCWARQTIVALGPVVPALPAAAVHHRRAEDRRRARPRPGRAPLLRRAPPPRRGFPPRRAHLRRPVSPRLHRPGQGPSSLPPDKVGQAGRAAPLRGVDHRPPGARRLLGRHPAAVGLLADGPEPARLRP